jgi:hypothetical protein
MASLFLFSIFTLRRWGYRYRDHCRFRNAILTGTFEKRIIVLIKMSDSLIKNHLCCPIAKMPDCNKMVI